MIYKKLLCVISIWTLLLCACTHFPKTVHISVCTGIIDGMNVNMSLTIKLLRPPNVAVAAILDEALSIIQAFLPSRKAI